MKSVFVSSGEPSGDLYASIVVRELRRMDPAIRIIGVGGPELQAAGMEQVADISKLGVLGFGSGLAALSESRRHIRQLRSLLDKARPDVFLPVSYSGVNLPLGRHARSLGIPVVWFSPPQVWAWGRWRARMLRGAAEEVVCLFPFEEPLLRRLGVNARFLGNPLVDLVRPPISGPRSLVSNEPIPQSGTGQRLNLVLLPGSRTREVSSLLPFMRLVAARLQSEMPGLEVSELPYGSDAEPPGSPIQPSNSRIPASILHRYQVMAGADLALAASGTVILELALLGVPMVVLYRLPALDYCLARLFVRLPWFSLPNLLLNAAVVPEFAQPKAKTVFASAQALLRDPERRRTMSAQLATLRTLLGPTDAAGRIARLVLQAAGPLTNEA